MSKTKFHPFFCYKKQCRKTAWETPEYLTESDWQFVEELIKALEAKDKAAFDKILYFRPKGYPHVKEGYEDRDYIFFNRVMGWPEGKGYYCRMSSDNHTYFNGFFTHELPNLKKALDNHRNP